jgi:hypothetical protein
MGLDPDSGDGDGNGKGSGSADGNGGMLTGFAVGYAPAEGQHDCTGVSIDYSWHLGIGRDDGTGGYRHDTYANGDGTGAHYDEQAT